MGQVIPILDILYEIINNNIQRLDSNQSTIGRYLRCFFENKMKLTSRIFSFFSVSWLILNADISRKSWKSRCYWHHQIWKPSSTTCGQLRPKDFRLSLLILFPQSRCLRNFWIFLIINLKYFDFLGTFISGFIYTTW